MNRNWIYLPESEKIIYLAQNFLGLPYRWGGDNPMTGFDCSGLIVELFKSVGIIKWNSDYNSQGLYNLMKSKEVSVPDRGCLIFFGKDKNSITHVALAIDKKLMIEAGGGNSQSKSIEEAIKQDAYVKVRPINYRSNLIAITRID